MDIKVMTLSLLSDWPNLEDVSHEVTWLLL